MNHIVRTIYHSRSLWMLTSVLFMLAFSPQAYSVLVPTSISLGGESHTGYGTFSASKTFGGGFDGERPMWGSAALSATLSPTIFTIGGSSSETYPLGAGISGIIGFDVTVSKDYVSTFNRTESASLTLSDSKGAPLLPACNSSGLPLESCQVTLRLEPGSYKLNFGADSFSMVGVVYTNGSFNYTLTEVPVPIPGSMWLLGSGAIVFLRKGARRAVSAAMRLS